MQVHDFFVWESLLHCDDSCPTTLLHQFCTSTNHKHTDHNFQAETSPTCSPSLRPLAFLHKAVCIKIEKFKCPEWHQTKRKKATEHNEWYFVDDFKNKLYHNLIVKYTAPKCMQLHYFHYNDYDIL
jgi:hypothetical protein